ncbi:hypothetical protein [Xanthocytophaga flava]|uniref:hypothetical protein n=1 Tax=Xanthocytophaga flava TaxID=3048013 RepID=UPI0028D5172B|nr:hypothetical protein [Xanthocytophaga flavus]
MKYIIRFLFVILGIILLTGKVFLDNRYAILVYNTPDNKYYSYPDYSQWIGNLIVIVSIIVGIIYFFASFRMRLNYWLFFLHLIMQVVLFFKIPLFSIVAFMGFHRRYVSLNGFNGNVIDEEAVKLWSGAFLAVQLLLSINLVISTRKTGIPSTKNLHS